MYIRYRLMQFMRGRYGADALFYVMFTVSAILAFVNIFLRSVILQAIVYVIMALAVLRVFSRNYAARSRENRAALAALTKLKNISDTRRQRSADYTHIYKKYRVMGIARRSSSLIAAGVLWTMEFFLE